MYVKEVSYDRETGDFAASLDGKICGYRATYMEAEELLDDLVYEKLRRSAPPVAPETWQAVSDSPASAFESIAVADILDELCAAVDAARITAALSAPWLRAIDKAWGWLLSQDCIEYRDADHALRVASATVPGRFYAANGACGCLGFTTGTGGVCWHRAAARLVRRALELRDKERVEAILGEMAVGGNVHAVTALGHWDWISWEEAGDGLTIRRQVRLRAVEHVHHITAMGCDCEAGRRPHWASALLQAHGTMRHEQRAAANAALAAQAQRDALVLGRGDSAPMNS